MQDSTKLESSELKAISALPTVQQNGARLTGLRNTATELQAQIEATAKESKQLSQVL